MTATSAPPRPSGPTPDHLATVRAARRKFRTRVRVVSIGLVATFVTAGAWALTLGSFPIAVIDLPGILLGSGTEQESFVVNDVRLPRVAIGALIGAALGVSGAIFQTLVRNELASPDIIGITQGASMGAVFSIIVVGSSPTTVSLAALGGGLLTAAFIYGLSSRNGLSGYRLILVGIGVGACLGAYTGFLMLSAEEREAERASIWLIGSLNGAGWRLAVPVAIALVVLVPAAALMRRALRTLQLGDDPAAGVGVRVNRSKGVVLAIGVGLASIATAAAGPITFVAFVCPAVTRRLLGNGDPALVLSGVTGAALVVASDAIGRFGIAGFDLPVGLVTGILGAPFLLVLLIQTNRSGISN